MFLANQFYCVFVLFLQFSGQLRFVSSQASPMEAHGVVPDVIDVAPAATITVLTHNFLPKTLILNLWKMQIKYDSGSTVDGGNELTPTQVQNEPIYVEWPVEEGAHYTLCMTGDLDDQVTQFDCN